MPDLIIIAGPNGAGKSTHSKELLTDHEIEAFDLDKEFYSIWSQFNFDPSVEQGAFEGAQKLYIDRRTAALNRKESFAFETNYHTRNIFSVIDAFRSEGYKTELIFICLESPEIAIERVKDRVAKGGHFVEETTIRERFKDGISLLDGSFDQFDIVSIYLSKPNNMEAILILEPYINKVAIFAPLPMELSSSLTRLTKYVKSHSNF